MTITVELSPETEERFLAEARLHGLSIDAYVEEFLARSAKQPLPPQTPPIDELNRLLDEAADFVPNGSTLADQAMSREGIYNREDNW